MVTHLNINDTSLGNIVVNDGVLVNILAQGGFSVLPPGGTTGQIPVKASNAPGDVAWVSQTDVDHGVPPGGTTAQVLLKTSNADYAAAFGDDPAIIFLGSQIIAGAYAKTDTGIKTLLVAAPFDRHVSMVVTIAEAFANHAGAQTVIKFGYTGAPTAFSAAITGAGTIAGLLPAGDALIVTVTPATVDGAGGITTSTTVTSLFPAIGAETARAVDAEGTLTTNLGNEVSRAEGVEGWLQVEVDLAVATGDLAMTYEHVVGLPVQNLQICPTGSVALTSGQFLSSLGLVAAAILEIEFPSVDGLVSSARYTIVDPTTETVQNVIDYLTSHTSGLVTLTLNGSGHLIVTANGGVYGGPYAKFGIGINAPGLDQTMPTALGLTQGYYPWGNALTGKYIEGSAVEGSTLDLSTNVIESGAGQIMPPIPIISVNNTFVDPAATLSSFGVSIGDQAGVLYPSMTTPQFTCTDPTTQTWGDVFAAINADTALEAWIDNAGSFALGGPVPGGYAHIAFNGVKIYTLFSTGAFAAGAPRTFYDLFAAYYTVNKPVSAGVRATADALSNVLLVDQGGSTSFTTIGTVHFSNTTVSLASVGIVNGDTFTFSNPLDPSFEHTYTVTDAAGTSLATFAGAFGANGVGCSIYSGNLEMSSLWSGTRAGENVLSGQLVLSGSASFFKAFGFAPGLQRTSSANGATIRGSAVDASTLDGSVLDLKNTYISEVGAQVLRQPAPVVSVAGTFINPAATLDGFGVSAGDQCGYTFFIGQGPFGGPLTPGNMATADFTSVDPTTETWADVVSAINTSVDAAYGPTYIYIDDAGSRQSTPVPGGLLNIITTPGALSGFNTYSSGGFSDGLRPFKGLFALGLETGSAISGGTNTSLEFIDRIAAGSPVSIIPSTAVLDPSTTIVSLGLVSFGDFLRFEFAPATTPSRGNAVDGASTVQLIVAYNPWAFTTVGGLITYINNSNMGLHITGSDPHLMTIEFVGAFDQLGSRQSATSSAIRLGGTPRMLQALGYTPGIYFPSKDGDNVRLIKGSAVDMSSNPVGQGAGTILPPAAIVSAPGMFIDPTATLDGFGISAGDTAGISWPGGGTLFTSVTPSAETWGDVIAAQNTSPADVQAWIDNSGSLHYLSYPPFTADPVPGGHIWIAPKTLKAFTLISTGGFFGNPGTFLGLFGPQHTVSNPASAANRTLAQFLNKILGIRSATPTFFEGTVAQSDSSVTLASLNIATGDSFRIARALNPASYFEFVVTNAATQTIDDFSTAVTANETAADPIVLSNNYGPPGSSYFGVYITPPSDGQDFEDAVEVSGSASFMVAFGFTPRLVMGRPSSDVSSPLLIKGSVVDASTLVGVQQSTIRPDNVMSTYGGVTVPSAGYPMYAPHILVFQGAGVLTATGTDILVGGTAIAPANSSPGGTLTSTDPNASITLYSDGAPGIWSPLSIVGLWTPA